MVEVKDLSEPQQEIINLCSDRNYVIQGGAGTGKTVIALYRAKKMSDENLMSLILVHNVPLKKYIDNVIKMLGISENCKALTYHVWLKRIYLSSERKDVPLMENPKSFGRQKDDYDFDAILDDLENCRIKITDDCNCNIIVDETQDFPPKLLRFVKRVSEISGKSVTCLIDPNQSIHNTETSLVEVLTEIKVESARTLDRNYRSTNESAEVAKLFWSHKGIFPKTSKSGQKPTMVSCSSVEEQVGKIASIAARYNFKGGAKGKTIGIFVNEKEEGLKMSEALGEELGKKYIQYRLSFEDDKKEDNDPTKIDFTKPGVKIFTYDTIKGLDFDAIVIGDNINYQNDEVYKNTLYMTLTRATSDIYICYKENDAPGDDNYFLKTLKANKELCEWE
ncbi:MAG: DUF2075 domain-containing protein [Treponema sp.]|nr:DUF2075 domain-containing protein [Treponema sp.]